jgi:hypothetical protein
MDFFLFFYLVGVSHNGALKWTQLASLAGLNGCLDLHEQTAKLSIRPL